MPTRSGPIARFHQTAAGLTTVVYTVPVDTTAIIKHVVVRNSDTVDRQTDVYAWNNANGAAGHMFTQIVIARSLLTWNGWLAMMPGDQLTLYTASPNLHLWVSGALLPGTI